jgi:hypothetical protein
MNAVGRMDRRGKNSGTPTHRGTNKHASGRRICNNAAAAILRTTARGLDTEMEQKDSEGSEDLDDGVGRGYGAWTTDDWHINPDFLVLYLSIRLTCTPYIVSHL